MTTLDLVDNAESVVENVAAKEDPQQADATDTSQWTLPSTLQKGACELDLEVEEEMEDVCEVEKAKEEQEYYSAVIKKCLVLAHPGTRVMQPRCWPMRLLPTWWSKQRPAVL